MSSFQANVTIFFDTHAHTDSFSANDWPEVASRAWHKGVRGNLSAGVWWDQCESLVERFSDWILPRCHDASDFKKVIVAAEKYCVLPCLGLHPMEVAERWRTLDGFFNRDLAESDAAELRRVANEQRHILWAMGETGFDAAKNVVSGWADRHELFRAQDFAFRACVELAIEMKLPLIIHSRSAWQKTKEAVTEARSRGLKNFMIHCYSGPANDLHWIAKSGGFASFGGVVTWPSASKVQQAVVMCPSESLLFETDSPDLAPVASDGSRPPRNEPQYLISVVQKVSALRGQSVGSLVEINFSNFSRFLFLN